MSWLARPLSFRFLGPAPRWGFVELPNWLAHCAFRVACPRPARRSRPALVSLEGRSVPAVIDPGESWHDGYVAPDGTVVPATVSVGNTGGGWGDASGGSGVAHVSPAAPPPGVTASPHHSILVIGTRVEWAGDTEYLRILTNAYVADIDISGSLDVGTEGSAGNLSGGDVRAGVWGSVGNVTATGDVTRLWAGAAIGNISAGGDVEFVSTPASVGAVSAGGWVGGVSAGLDIGGVTAGTWVGGSYLEGGGDYTAWLYAPNYGGVAAGRDILGPVTAGRSVANVTAGRDVKGAVTAAAGDVWVVQAGGGGTFDPGADLNDPGGGWVPYAPGRVVGAVTAGRDVHFVSATGDVAGAVTAQSGWVGWVLSDGSVSGNVTAGTDVGRGTDREGHGEWLSRWMWGGVYGPWLYLVPGVRAGVDVSGAVTARTGSVERVTAGRDVAGIVKADHGDVAEVEAGRDVLTAVTAGVDVGRVAAGRDVAEAVTAGQDITRVRAERDVVGAVEGGRDIAEVAAGRDVIGAVDAGRDVGWVTATDDIVGAVAADRNIGNVSAGGDLVGGLTADDSIGTVHVGWDAGGAVIGPITACVNVGDITVYGQGGSDAAAGNSPNPERPFGSSTYALDGLMLSVGPDGMTVYGNPGTTRPAAPAVPTGGDLRGAVSAGGNVGVVTAYGAITAAIDAGGTIGGEDSAGGVWAAGSITGAVTAGAGTLGVRSWAQVEGAVSAPGDVVVWSYGNLVGDVASRDGAVTAGSWHDVTGAVTAKTDADVRAFGNVAGSSDKAVRSDTGQVRVWAGEKAQAEVSAQTEVGIYGRKGAGGPVRVESRDGSVFVETGVDGDIVGDSLSGDGRYRVEAQVDVSLKSGGSIGGTKAVAADGHLTADAAKDAKLEGTAWKNVWVSARGGAVDGKLDAQTGWAYAWAFTDLKGEVTAKETVSATAWSDLTAKLESTDDGVEAFAKNDLTGKITAKEWIDIEAGGDVTGELRAGEGSESASVFVRGGGNLSSPKIYSGGWIDAAVTGNISAAEVEAGGRLQLTADGDVGSSGGKLTAGGDANVTAGLNFQYELKAESVRVAAGVNVFGNLTSTEEGVYIHAGVNSQATATAKDELVVEAGGEVSGSYSGGPGVSAVAGGNITGTFVGDWVVDVRSENGSVAQSSTTTRKDRNAWLTDAESPYVKRLNVVRDKRAALAAAGLDETEPAKDLAAQEELMIVQPTTNFDQVDKTRLKDMKDNGLAYMATGLGVATGVEGYIMVVDAVSGAIDTKIFEPMLSGHPIGGQYAAFDRADSYRLVYRVNVLPDSPDVLLARVEGLRQAGTAQGYVERWRQGSHAALMNKVIDFGVHLAPPSFRYGELREGGLRRGSFGPRR